MMKMPRSVLVLRWFLRFWRYPCPIPIIALVSYIILIVVINDDDDMSYKKRVSNRPAFARLSSFLGAVRLET